MIVGIGINAKLKGINDCAGPMVVIILCTYKDLSLSHFNVCRRSTSPLKDCHATSLPPQSLTLDLEQIFTPLDCNASVSVGKVSFQIVQKGHSPTLNRHRVLVAYELGLEPKNQAQQTTLLNGVDWAVKARWREETETRPWVPGEPERGGPVANMAQRFAERVVQTAKWCVNVECKHEFALLNVVLSESLITVLTDAMPTCMKMNTVISDMPPYSSNY